MTVEVKASTDGWLLTYKDRQAGPFRNLNAIDIVGVAAELSGLDQRAVEEWKAHPGENTEKWAATPKEVFKAKLRLDACITKGTVATNREPGEAFLTRMSKLDAGLVGKRVRINGQVVSEQSQKAVPSSLHIFCSRCREDAIVNLLKNESLSLLQAVIFKQKKDVLKLAEAHLVDNVGSFCDDKSGHRIRVEEQGFMDYAVLGVRDLLEEVEKFDRQVYQSRMVHLVGAKVPPSKKVKFEGVVAVDPVSRDLCVLADHIKPLENQVAGFRITDEDRTEWPKWFNSQLNISTQIAPDMVGREVVQQAYLLLLHSPPDIPDIHGKTIRGCLRILCFGDTKTYKSESAKDLTISHYGLGGFVVAESSSRTGITYSIDTENRAIVWGELPNNDLGLTVIDGLHSMFAEEMKELREALENQRIIVRRYVSGEALARTRVIGIFNPNKPMNQYIYPCMAVKDSASFYDPPDITRWDLFLPFAKDDVPKEEVASRKPKERPIPEECFKRHVYWAWSRLPKHVSYAERAKDFIVKASVDLMKEYSLSNLPIVHLGIRDMLCRLSVAQACRDHSTDETHTLIRVDIEHVIKALDFYQEMLSQLRLKEYKLEEEGQLEISPSEFERILTDLGKVEMDILKSIKIHSKGSPALAAELDLSDRTIREHYKSLKKHGLITTTAKIGASLTARGVKFLKALTSKGYEIVKKNFTVSQRLSEGDKEFSLGEPIIVALKTWCITNRNERSEINLLDLADFIKKELKQNPQRVIKLAFDQAILMPSPKPGKAVVV